MNVVLTFVGRLHPVIVHLPIGFILLALLLEWMANRRTDDRPELKKGMREIDDRPGLEKVTRRVGDGAGLKQAADLTLGLGVLAAIISCCTGLLLSRSVDYDQDLVTTHLWLAISLTIVTAILFGQLNNKPQTTTTNALSILTLLLIFLTGHYGGSLTHGPGYLTSDLEAKPQPPALKPVADVQNAVVYTAIVQPILHDNCYGCHSAGHVKGGLRLDGPDMIKKGGKDGEVLGVEGLLLKRISLPLEDDHHMAPKEKPQLTTAELKVLKWWMATGASFDQPASRLQQDNDIHAVLAAFQDGTAGPTATETGPQNIADSDMPSTPMKLAPTEAIHRQEAIHRLEAAGALVLPIAANSFYLTVSFPQDSIGKDALNALGLVSQQIVEIKFSHLSVGDALVTAAAGCPHLVRLWLDHTNITGKNLGELTKLDDLRYLNVVGTSVDEASIKALGGAKGLRQLYLYQTNVRKTAWPELKAVFPHTILDSGGYRLIKLQTDTATYRKPKQPG